MAHSTNKTDQLFRRKLETLEVTPQVSSWEAVSGQIHKKRVVYFPVWRVAASVVILLSVGYFVFQYSQTSQNQLVAETTERPKTTEVTTGELAKEIPVPQPINQPTVTSPLKKEEIKKAQDITPKPAVITPENKVGQPAPKKDSDLNQFHFFSVDRVEAIGVEVAQVTTIPDTIGSKAVSEEQPAAVKITYIASNPDKRDFELPSLEKISKVISKAQDLTPGELLADIRDAKHHLLNRN